MLKCRATGSPAPAVKWKRDDNSKIAINKSLIGKERERGRGKYHSLSSTYYCTYKTSF